MAPDTLLWQMARDFIINAGDILEVRFIPSGQRWYSLCDCPMCMPLNIEYSIEGKSMGMLSKFLNRTPNTCQGAGNPNWLSVSVPLSPQQLCDTQEQSPMHRHRVAVALSRMSLQKLS